jgi:hypothetical protein
LPKLLQRTPGRSHTSSDGQKLEVHVDSLTANHSFKYFGKEQGVSVYTFRHETKSAMAEKLASEILEARVPSIPPVRIAWIPIGIGVRGAEPRGTKPDKVKAKEEAVAMTEETMVTNEESAVAKKTVIAETAKFVAPKSELVPAAESASLRETRPHSWGASHTAARCCAHR